jgi:hypothetical protein
MTARVGLSCLVTAGHPQAVEAGQLVWVAAVTIEVLRIGTAGALRGLPHLAKIGTDAAGSARGMSRFILFLTDPLRYQRYWSHCYRRDLSRIFANTWFPQRVQLSKLFSNVPHFQTAFVTCNNSSSDPALRYQSVDRSPS